jgi:ketosteroid isomerase-like protein
VAAEPEDAARRIDARRWRAGLLGLAACAACAANPRAVPAVGPGDPGAEALAADRGLAAAVAAHDLSAFAALLDAEALFFGGRGLAPGRAAVLERWAPLLAEGGPRLTWAPDRAEAAASGDLVFTFGASVFQADGEPPEPGRYLTAWRRGADGRLRVIVDAPDQPLPPLPDGVVRRALRTTGSADGTRLVTCGLLFDQRDGREFEVGHYVELLRRDEAGRLVPLAEAGSYRPAP